MLEYSDHQGTELETGLMSTLCHSTSQNTPSVLTQQPCVEMETPTDFNATNHEVAEQSAVKESCSGANSVNNTATTNQCDVNEQVSAKEEMKERELPSQSDPPDLCCDHAVNVDLMAVIDYDAETGTPVCVVDVDINPRFSW